MRFVAGRGAVAERLVRGTALAELLAREPPAQRTACWGAVAEQGHSRGRAPSGRCCLLWHRRCGASWQAGRGADEAAARQGRRQRARAPTMRKRRCGARTPSMHKRRCGASWQAGRGAVAEQGRCRAFAARNRRCCGARAPTIRSHRRGARAANKVQAPLRGKGAGREQELARGVRS